MSHSFVFYCTNYNYLFVFQYQLGWTLLHRAARYNKVEVARVLVEAGAKIDVTDEVMICFLLNKLQMCTCVQLIKSSGIYCEPHLFHSMVSYV